jgi:hypothetical protein
MADAVHFALMFLAVPFLGVATGFVYFRQSENKASFARRILTSAYGPSIAIIYIVLIALVPNDFRYQRYLHLFWWGLLLPTLLIVYSIFRYPGSRKLHMLVPFNLVALGWLFIVGTLAIGGK